MHELHSIGWYSSQVAPRLPAKVFKPAPERLWGGLAFVLLAAGSMTAIALFELHWLAKLGLSVLIAQCFAGLGFLGHEILHGTVVKQARLRDWLGGIAMSQFLLGPKLWRRWHNMEHHAHTQHVHDDPDVSITMEQLYQKPFLRWLYKFPWQVRSFTTFVAFSVFFQIHSSRQFARLIGQFKPKDRAMAWAQLLAPIAFYVFGLGYVLGLQNWLFAYLIPLLIANFITICYISSNHDLCPLTDVNDPLVNSLSVKMPRWMDVIHFNFSYHTEHHLFPGVSPKWGPLIQQHLREMFPERYNELTMKETLRGLWCLPRVYMDDSRLVDMNHSLAFPVLGRGFDKEEPRAAAISVSEDDRQQALLSRMVPAAEPQGD